MTGKDSQPEDDAGRPGDGEDPLEALPDGGSDGSGDSPERTDGSGETNAGFPGAGDERTDTRTDADGGRRTGAADFAGFDFGTWMEQTEPRESATAEETAAEAGTEGTADPEAAYPGFSFDEWMDDEDIAPDEPVEPAGATAESRAASAGLLALFPFVGNEQVESGPDRFEFADWLGEDETEYIDPEMLRPDRTAGAAGPADAGAALPEEGGYPTPPGGGISDLPPVKLAVFAVFAATFAAVGLTLAGGVAPLGPASGFVDSGEGGGGQPAPAATQTPTPEPTPEPTSAATDTSADTPEPTGTPEPTDTPVATPTATPTPAPTPTPTATPESTGTPESTPTETEDDDLIDI